MRIDALDLIAFGHFDGHVIPLSATPGLNLVYGKNEAGKSTALRAIHAALYGVPTHEQQDRWKHGDHIRVGLHIDGPNGPLRFVRHRGRKNTLRDADDKPYPDDILAPYLGAVDEATFRILFGLNHSRLVEEGRALMEGGGELGKTLFSAGSGIGHFREVIASLDKDGQAIFAKRAQKPLLNAALKQYSDARKRVQEYSVSPKRWKELTEALAQAEARLVDIADARVHTETRLRRLSRFIDALPLLASRAAVLEELRPLGDGPAVDTEMISRFERSIQLRLNAEREGREAAEKRAQWAELLPTLEADDAILAHGEGLSDLQEGRKRYLGAKQDLESELRPKLETRKQDWARALERIAPHTRDQGEAIVAAGAAQRRRLTELLAGAGTVEDEHEEARRELARIETRLTELDAAIDGLGAAPDAKPLLRALESARDNSPLEREVKQLCAELESGKAELDEQMKRLAADPKTWSDLLERSLPGNSLIEEHRDAVEKLRSDQRLAEAHRKTCDADCDDARKKLETFAAQHELATAEELAQARADRDSRVEATFAAIAGKDLAAAAAEGPELRQAVSRADALADRMLAESREAEQLAQAQRSLALQEQRRDAAVTQCGALEARAAELDTQWQALWKGWTTPPSAPLDSAEWLRQHAQFQKDVRAFRDKEARRAFIATVLDEDKAAIRKLLEGTTLADKLEASHSHAAHLEALTAAAEAQAEAAAQYNEQCRDRDRIRQEEQPKAREAVERKAAARDAWQAAWQAMGEELRLTAETTPDALRPLLDDLEALPRIREDITALEERIAQVESALDAYEKQCATLCAALDEKPENEAPEQIVRDLVERHKQAEAVALQRANTEERIAEAAEQIEKAATRAGEAQAELESLRLRLGAPTLEALPEAIKLAQKRQELEQKREGIEDKLRLLAGGQALEAFVAELAQADREALEVAHSEAQQKAEALRSEESTATEARAQARIQLDAADTHGQAAEAALEAESLAAQIERQLARYLRIKLAEAALATAIERYQEANEQPILLRASQYFQQLTLNRFARLRTDFRDDGGQTLLAERPDGARLRFDALSEGSADQLYLALRLAGLEQHFTTHAPMPFIVDDCFINFDDERAGAGLQALAEFAQQTQVIFFTHHSHLIDLARAQLPSDAFTVHELP